MGADIDATDKEGRTPLHIAVIRMNALLIEEENSDTQTADQNDQIFTEYKTIIKELLFNGADRSLKTNEGLTALQIFEENSSLYTAVQQTSLRIILKEPQTCICFQRYRPIEKVTKSPWILIAAVVINLFIFVDFYAIFEIFNSNNISLLPIVHKSLLYASIIALSIAIPSFILSAALEPGYLRKKFDFIDLVDEMIQNERDLWNLCTYCELIKS